MSSRNSPNILCIMTDQMRYDCIGANGNNTIHTPHLDAFTRESANMHSCFVQAPVCVPSRQTIFTGRYPHSHKNRVNYTPLDSSEVLMQEHMRRNGYRTSFIGKLHYWPPTHEHALKTGFESGLLHDGAKLDEHSDYVGWLRSAAPQYADDFRACVPASERAPGANPFCAQIPDEYHETTWCGTQTRSALRELAGGDQPFFLFSSYWRPHSPFEVPEPWASMYNDTEIPLPSPGSPEYVSLLPPPLQKLILRDSPRPWEMSEDEIRWIYRSYYGAISQIDREVGATLKTLEDAGIEENTIVVFMSDHGDLLGEHAIFGKNAFFEGAIHVPLLIRYPSRVTPGDYRELIEGADLLSTLCNLAGIDIPYSNQGRSFAPLIGNSLPEKEATEYTPRRFVASENIIPEVITTGGLQYPFEPETGIAGIRHPDAKMIRTDRWKYVYYPIYGEQLYDLESDPSELADLSADSRYSEIIQELRRTLLDWLITADEKDQIAQRWLTND